MNTRSLIKPNCVTCGVKLPKTAKHFKRYGNWCAACNILSDHIIRRKKEEKAVPLDRYAILNEEIYKQLEQAMNEEMATGYPI